MSLDDMGSLIGNFSYYKVINLAILANIYRARCTQEQLTLQYLMKFSYVIQVKVGQENDWGDIIDITIIICDILNIIPPF